MVNDFSSKWLFLPVYVKQIVSILLLSLLLLTSLRYQIFRSFTKSQKASFRQELLLQNKKEIIFIELATQDLFKDKDGLEWKDENKELTINGQYHEVLKLVKKGASTLVYLIADKKESELYANYFQTQNSNNGTYHFLKLFLSLQYYCPDAKNTFIIPVAEIFKLPILSPSLQKGLAKDFFIPPRLISLL